MNFTRKTLAALGIAAISAVAVPAAASANSVPQMYDSCSTAQQGDQVKTATGDVLRCVETNGGHDWESPSTD